jgi:hypothetical protein
MKTHWIEIDDKIWRYLQDQAEPLVDTANSVLHKLLFKTDQSAELKPLMTIKGLPKSLSQVLEVVYEIEYNGATRSEATRMVADRHNTVPSTIMDKYCRQLNKKANEIDLLFKEPGYVSFSNLLKEKYPMHKEIIDTFLGTIDKERSSK